MQRADLLVPGAWLSPRKKRFWLLLLIACYTLAGFLLVPWLLKTNLNELARQYAGRDAEVSNVRFNPWTLRLQVNGFVLHDRDQGVFTSFDELIANLQVSSIFKRAFVFHEVTLIRPVFNLIRYAYADTNVQRLLADIEAAAATTASAPAETASEEPLRLVIDTLNLTAGIIELRDGLPDTPFTTRLEPIDISVNDLSTLPDKTGAQQITVRTENGSNLKWSGSLQLTPLQSAGTVAVSGSPLPLVYRYLKDQLGFRLQDCCLDLTLDYSLESKPNGVIAARVQNLDISSRELELHTLDNDELVLRVPEIKLTDGELEWPAQKVRIAELRFVQPAASIWIREDGLLNLAILLPEESAAPALTASAGTTVHTGPTAEIATTPDSPAEPMETVEPTETVQPATATEPGWDLQLAKLYIDGMQIAFADRSLPRPGQLAIPKLDVSITDISNRPEARSAFTIAAQVGEKGRVDLQGDTTLLPAVDLNTQLKLTDFALRDLQPWIEPLARVAIEDGLVSFSGTLASNDREQLALEGNLNVLKLAVSDTLENVPLLGWKELAVQKARFKVTKNSLNISQIIFSEPFLRLIIAADGSTNFAALAKDTAADNGPAGSAAPATDGTTSTDTIRADDQPKLTSATPRPATQVNAPLRIRLGQTLINDGKIEFADLSLPLPFEVPVYEFGGSISALATDSQGTSDIDLEGKVGKFGYVSVDGAINAAAPTQQADVNVVFRNINVPDLSPYTVEFAGRKVATGKLDLDLKYQFEESIMRGDNKILLDKFQLGERVENPDALDLPLDLAVSLLKDSNGVIDLQLEVTGDLSDPSFSAAGVFLKVLTNLITKAATAPFKLLAGLLPGNPDIELDKLDFRPGRAKLLPPEREKLQQLATALAQRPQLVLTVPGNYNAELDTRALQRKAVADQVAELVGDAEDEEQELLSKRTRKALEKLADTQLPDLDLGELREQFERPQPDSGNTALDQIAYMAELRQQLETVQQIDSTQLEALAERRQAAILANLQNSGKLNSAQLATGTLGETTDVKNDYVRIELEVVASAAGAPAQTPLPADLSVGAGT